MSDAETTVSQPDIESFISGEYLGWNAKNLTLINSFNLAGLQTAAVVVPNEVLRHKMERALNTDEVAEPNAFAIDAAVAAFTQGEGWLDALNIYLAENRRMVRTFLEQELPDVSPVSSHATYLLWLDCSRVMGDAGELCRYLRKLLIEYI